MAASRTTYDCDENLELIILKNKSKSTLCSLNTVIRQQILDLTLFKGEEVAFRVKGQGEICLSGCLLDTDDSDEEAVEVIQHKKAKLHRAEEKSVMFNIRTNNPSSTIKLNSKTKVQDLIIGNGAAVAAIGSKVSIDYVAMDYRRKKVIGTNIGEQTPLILILGDSYTDENLSNGIVGMCVNGRRKINCGRWYYFVDLLRIFN